MKKNKTKETLVWLQTRISSWSGGTRFIFEVLKELSRTYEVKLLVEECEDSVVKEFYRNNINISKIGIISSGNVLYWLFLPLFLIFDYFQIKKHVGKNTKLISSMFPMNVLANLVDSNNHIQYIFEPFAFFHDRQMIEGLPNIRKWFVKILGFMYSWVDIYFTRKSKYIMTINDGVGYWVKKVYKRSYKKTYLIVNTKFFKPYVDTFLKNKYKNNMVVLHSTDYTPLKRTDYLIRSFVNVVKLLPQAILIIIQPTENHNEKFRMEKLVRSLNLTRNVIFAGKVKVDDLPKYYSVATCSVYPGVGSGASASSYFVLESMACGTPVVRTSDTNEEIIDGVNGYLFDAKNDEKMVKLIVKLLENRKTQKKFGKMARKRIIETNNASKVTNRFEYLINSL